MTQSQHQLMSALSQRKNRTECVKARNVYWERHFLYFMAQNISLEVQKHIYKATGYLSHMLLAEFGGENTPERTYMCILAFLHQY